MHLRGKPRAQRTCHWLTQVHAYVTGCTNADNRINWEVTNLTHHTLNARVPPVNPIIHLGEMYNY